MLQLRTFGRLELLAGEPAALQLLPAQPKPLALLSYLAVATPRGPHRRDALLALFWPELREEEARRALRQALHRLRYHVGDELLRTERDGQLGIADQGAWCDAVAFEQALDAGHPAEALALYQGAFLDGIFVADASPDFEQWVDLTRTRLARRAAAAAGTLAAEARRTGDQTGELRWAAQASRLAPDAESHLRALMAALTDQGDRTGALRAYQSFADRIAEDFGAEPAADTAALAQALRAGPSGAGPSTASPAPVREPLHDADSARSGHPHPKGRWPLALGIVLASAVLALIVYLGLNSSGAAPAIDGILVADFRNHTRDSLLAGAVAEALRVDLSQSHRTRVMSRGQVHAVLQHMQQPTGDLLSDELVREVAERYGVKAFVTGDVAAMGTGFTVSAELIAVKGGEILVSVREDAADSTRLLAAVDRVSEQLRRGVGESLWSLHGTPPLEQVTTSSLQALRLYSEAIRVGDLGGDERRAVEMLHQAVALDTTFAMAYRKLGVYLRNFGDLAGADDALAHAFRFRSRLPELERYHTAGSYYANSALPDSAIAAYRALLAIAPNDTRALNNLADVYENLKDFARAEPLFRRAVESDSSIMPIFNHLATNQFNSGRYDAAEATLKVRNRRFAPQLDDEALAVSIEMMRGHLDTARARTARMLNDSSLDAGSRAEILTRLEALSLLRGRLAEADRERHTVAELRGINEGNSQIELAIDFAFVDTWYRHLPERGLALLDAAVARTPLDSMPPLARNYALLAYQYALAGRPVRARQLLAELRASQSVPGTTRGGLGLSDEGGYLRALGVTELAEGRPAEAVITLRRSVDLYFCPICTLPDLARAFEAAGAPDSAIVTYQKYVTTPWSEWQNAGGEFRGSAWQRLGALHEARGDTALAIAAYDQFSALWGDADAELQPLVAAARLRRSALSRAP